MSLQIIIIKFCFKTFLRVGRLITSRVYLKMYRTMNILQVK